MTPGRPDPIWQPFLRIGGMAAGVFVVMVLVPVVLLGTAPIPPDEGHPLLEYIADHRAVYLVQLVCFVGLAIPALVVFAAVAVALSGVARTAAALGGLLGVASEVVALAVGSSPQSLHGGLIVLSDAYAGASTDAERAGLVAAADALIAATNAMPWAGILTAGAILVLSWGMWGSGFGRVLTVFGLVTGALGLVSEALRPVMGTGYLLYGLLLPVWFAWVGVGLVRSAAVPGQRSMATGPER